MSRLAAVHRLFLFCMVIAALATAGCATPNQATADRPRRNSANIITADEIAEYMGQSLSELIIMKITGVTRKADGSLLIRGNKTFYGSTAPLYVLDGIPVSGEPLVNIKDLEEIEVLKGADAGIYGVRGANGVILITTKS